MSAPRDSRLKDTFARTHAEGRAALVTYLMGGDPDLETACSMARACIRAGADILEIGFPFSDPIADGPTIQRAAERALASGTTLAGCLEMAARLRAETETPLVLMGYLNPILAFGEERFLDRAAEAGVSALIIPDLPPEEASELVARARERGIDVVFLLAPTSTDARCEAVFAAASGFVYYVSVTGVTGARAELPANLGERLARLREKSPVPLVVGFGISTPEQAKGLGKHADGVVVGSAVVSRIAEGAGAEPRVEDLVRSLRRALDAG